MLGINALTPLLSLLIVGQTSAPEASDTGGGPEDPLFTSHDMITMEIEGPIEDIRDDRADEPEYRDVTVRWSVGSGEGELAARVRTRGNFRKKKSTCRMPPLRMNFAKKEVTGTLFGGQDKLKLVTHCRNGDDYEQNVLEEYLAYRLYNLLTDQSFRARLLRITYTDPTRDDDPLVRYGFFIEDEDRMAARLGGTIEEFEQMHPFRLVEGSQSRIALFQYMIGNTDFSIVNAHNVRVVRTEDGELVPAPYDFDWAGLVGAGYARPNETLGLRNVRQRLYRGFCEDGQDFTEMVQPFLAVESELEGVFAEMAGWTEKDQKRGREYLADFFETISDPKKIDREFARKCRELAG